MELAGFAAAQTIKGPRENERASGPIVTELCGLGSWQIRVSLREMGSTEWGARDGGTGPSWVLDALDVKCLLDPQSYWLRVSLSKP